MTLFHYSYRGLQFILPASEKKRRKITARKHNCRLYTIYGIPCPGMTTVGAWFLLLDSPPVC